MSWRASPHTATGAGPLTDGSQALPIRLAAARSEGSGSTEVNQSITRARIFDPEARRRLARLSHPRRRAIEVDRGRLYAMMAIVVILIVLWLLGIVTKTMLGG